MGFPNVLLIDTIKTKEIAKWDIQEEIIVKMLHIM